MKRQLIGKDPDAGKDGGQEEKGVTEDEMVGGLHQLNGREFEKASGDGERRGGLACCSPRGLKDWNETSQLNNNEKSSSCLQLGSKSDNYLDLGFCKADPETGSDCRQQADV